MCISDEGKKSSIPMVTTTTKVAVDTMKISQGNKIPKQNRLYSAFPKDI